MIDIHCHPLWEVDDGADTFEEAVAMCAMAAADGVKHLVATPHANDVYTFDPEVNRRKLVELQSAIGDTPRLLLGCDFHLSYDNIQECIQRPKDFTINNTSYLLVELPDQFIPEQIDRVFYEIQVAGLTPIITHPERNSVCVRKPRLLYYWVMRGCLVQVTAQSLTGRFGSQARRLVARWLEGNLIHFFASDAHDLKHRPPILSECYQKVAECDGHETASRLFRNNPQSVINGTPMLRQPPPMDPSDQGNTRSWLSHLLGRS